MYVSVGKRGHKIFRGKMEKNEELTCDLICHMRRWKGQGCKYLCVTYITHTVIEFTPQNSCLNTCFSSGGALWRGLRSGALLERVCHWWSFEVSETPFSTLYLMIVCQLSALVPEPCLLPACFCAAHSPAMVVMDSNPLKLFCKLTWSRCLITAIGK